MLDAIRHVESGGRCDVVGDNGKALGPYQIHKDYWKDAVGFDSSLKGKYEDVTNEAYARRVVIAYLTRYCGKNASAETYARTHNGGPKGSARRATLKYWIKVKRFLNKKK